MKIEPGSKFYKYTVLCFDHWSVKARKDIYRCQADDGTILLIREDHLTNRIKPEEKQYEFDIHYSDIINDTKSFGYLVPIKFDHYEPRTKEYPKRNDFYRCKCTRCNRNELILLTRRQLTIEGKKDCGCSFHDLTNIPRGFYNTYNHMKARCDKSYDPSYPNYGGRGITYDPRWKDFNNFVEDMLDSYLAHVKIYGTNNTTLERIDVNKGYYKENCCWITKSAQASNKQNTKYYTIGKEPKFYTSRELMDKFCDPTIEYYKLRRRLVESKHYCKDANIINLNVFIDENYRATLYKPISIIGEDTNSPIRFIDNNMKKKYEELRLPKTFTMNPYYPVDNNRRE